MMYADDDLRYLRELMATVGRPQIVETLLWLRNGPQSGAAALGPEGAEEVHGALATLSNEGLVVGTIGDPEPIYELTSRGYGLVSGLIALAEIIPAPNARPI